MEVIVTKENFAAEVLNSDIPVILDFYATWCGPCKMVAPLLAQIAQENAGKIKVCKVNVDEQMELAMQYGVASIPTLYGVKNGQPVAKVVGYAPKEKLLALVK